MLNNKNINSLGLNDAINYLIYLLSRREYSEFELRQKLLLKKYTADIIEQALEHCKSKGYQSDDRFASMFITARLERGMGIKKIHYELRNKGISTDIIDKIVQDLEDLQQQGLYLDNKARAIELINRRYGELDFPLDLKFKQKIFRFMFSRGFEPDDFMDFLNSK